MPDTKYKHSCRQRDIKILDMGGKSYETKECDYLADYL